jgi:hypothetical protein
VGLKAAAAHSNSNNNSMCSRFIFEDRDASTTEAMRRPAPHSSYRGDRRGRKAKADRRAMNRRTVSSSAVLFAT